LFVCFFCTKSPEIENKSPEIKKTAFRRRLQRPRENSRMAIVKSVDAAVKQVILGADRSSFTFDSKNHITCHDKKKNLHATALKPFSNFASVFEYFTIVQLYSSSIDSMKKLFSKMKSLLFTWCFS